MPVTDVRTNGGRLTLIDDGTELSNCWVIWSTAADTVPTGHWICVGAWDPTPGTPDDGGATDPAGPVDGDVAGEAVEPAEPGMVDVAVAPAPTAAWLELLAGLLVSGTRIWPLTKRAMSTTAAAAAAPTGAAIQRLASRARAGSMGTTSGGAAAGATVGTAVGTAVGTGAAGSPSAGLASTRPMAAITAAGGTSSSIGAKFLIDHPVGSRSRMPNVSSRIRARVTSSSVIPCKRPSPARSSGSQWMWPSASALSRRTPRNRRQRRR